MAEEKLRTARAYIDSGDYKAAKAILETIPDNHTAQRWLRKLAERLPAETQSQSPLPEQPFPDPDFGVREQPQMSYLEQPREKVRQRWEYCVLGSIGHVFSDGRMATYDTVLIHFSSVGSHRTQNKIEIATMIAQLGDEGWEMVGAGTAIALATLSGTGGTLGHVLYFKRPLMD